MILRTITSSGEELLDAVFGWLSELQRDGIRLAVLEGLPGAGKSTLLEKLKSEFVSWYLIELDDFLRKPEDQGRAWTDLVIERGTLTAIGKWLSEGPTLVEGPAAWPVVREWMAHQGEAPRVARAYFKRVTRYGDVVFWDDGEGLAEHAESHQTFFASIYRYHADEQPWLTADIVLQRVANDDID